MNARVIEHDAETAAPSATRPQRAVATQNGGHLAPASDDASSLMAVISRAASDPAVDINKLERLMAMHKDVLARHAEQAFNDAMTQAQAELRRIATDSNNPQTKSRYASYAALDSVIRPIYTKHGFGLSFNTAEGPPEHVRVVCDVSHVGGHTRRHNIDMPADGKGAKGGDVMTKTHATGSAVTYGRRYLLTMIFNLVVGADDDGNAASNECIGPQQLEKLQERIVEAGIDRSKVCTFAHVEKLEQITVGKYDRVLAGIDEWERKAGQRGARR